MLSTYLLRLKYIYCLNTVYPKKTKEQAMDTSTLEQQTPVFMSQNTELMAQLPGNIVTKSTNYNHKSQNRINCKNFQIF